MDSLSELTHNYNTIISMAAKNSGSSGDSSRLFKELQRISRRHTNSLESAGLTFDENGAMKADESLVTQSVAEGNIRDSLELIEMFKDDL